MVLCAEKKLQTHEFLVGSESCPLLLPLECAMSLAEFAFTAFILGILLLLCSKFRCKNLDANLSRSSGLVFTRIGPQSYRLLLYTILSVERFKQHPAASWNPALRQLTQPRNSLILGLHRWRRWSFTHPVTLNYALGPWPTAAAARCQSHRFDTQKSACS